MTKEKKQKPCERMAKYVGAEASSAHHSKAFHELLAELEREFRVETREHFFAAIRIHRGQFAHEFVPHFPSGVTTPADADGEQRGYRPHGDVSIGNHGGQADERTGEISDLRSGT